MPGLTPGRSTLLVVPDETSRMAMLDLSVEAGPSTVISLAGDLDPATAPMLEEAIEAAMEDASVKQIVLDLSQLSFVDSSGLRVFVTTRESLGSRGGELILRRPTANTRRLLDITGLGEVIDIQD